MHALTDFQEGKYKTAHNFYEKITQFLDQETDLEEEQKTRRDALVLAANLNLAMCKLKMGNFADAIGNCEKALEMDATNVKALFRRGQVKLNFLPQIYGKFRKKVPNMGL